MTFAPTTVTLMSVGLLGGSIGLALRRSGFTGRIIGLSSPSTLPLALEIGCIDEGYSYAELPEVAARTDLLVLCSPVDAIVETIGTLAAMRLPAHLVITDVGSTKQEIMNAALALPPHVRFLGGHPMAGSEKSGPAAADPYLFQNAIYVLTPPGGEAAETDRSLAAFLERNLGCRTLFLDAPRHDRIVAAVSHLPHLLAVALVNCAQDVETKIPGTLALAAGGFRDMTRIAGAPFDLWRDILSTNAPSIEPLIDDMIDRLARMKGRLRDGSLRECFEESRQTRRRVPANAKGFIGQLSEVLIVIKDEPGAIARIANALAQNDINIKDIEVLKVREGEGGTIRLAFDSTAVARAALAILRKAGITARERT